MKVSADQDNQSRSPINHSATTVQELFDCADQNHGMQTTCTKRHISVASACHAGLLAKAMNTTCCASMCWRLQIQQKEIFSHTCHAKPEHKHPSIHAQNYSFPMCAMLARSFKSRHAASSTRKSCEEHGKTEVQASLAGPVP